MSRSSEKLSGNEIITFQSKSASVLDFWQWAFSDLKSNTTRGLFGEWLVASLLDIDAPVRDTWAECDLITSGGIKIEVKTSAYLQSWQQKQPSRICFGNLCGQTWNPECGYSGTATYNADLYIFCLNIELDQHKWNALDVKQWRFYILTKEQIAKRNLKTISLNTIRAMTSELTANELKEYANDVPINLIQTGCNQD